MADPIFNDGPVTPPRLYALVRLIPRLSKPKRQDLLDLLQPPGLIENQKAADLTYNAARVLNLVEEDADQEKSIRLTIPRNDIETPHTFRLLLQRKLCGITDSSDINYLLGEYVAWYAVQDGRVFSFKSVDFENRFNEEVYPGYTVRPFNTTKLPHWRVWASYLGWGWPMPLGNTNLLIPDCYDRLKPCIPELLWAADGDLRFDEFARRLAERCPELDGGSLFERCWEASRGSETRGNRLSLMLSTGLRGLHDEGRIELIDRADATDNWQLFPAEGHPVNGVTHVRVRES